MRARTLSKEEKRRKRTLKKIVVKTPEQKKELSVLEAKVAPPEPEYERELEGRSQFQKFFNRFYKKKDKANVSPKELLRIPVEGISEVYANSRKPFNKQQARIPNNTLPNSPDLEPREFRMIDGVKIPLATQIIVEYMNIPLLYARWKGEPPKEKLEDIPDEDFQEFVDLIKEKLDADVDYDTIAREVFHFEGGLEEANHWVKDHEEGLDYASGVYKVADYNQQQPDGTFKVIQIVMQYGAGNLNRYIARITNGKDTILLVKENNDHLCPDDAPDNSRDAYNPLTTLKSDGCFVILNSKYFDRIGSEFGPDGGRIPEGGPKYYNPTMVRKNWIILNPDYFPIKGAPLLPLMAKYFGIATYIQDALNDWAIEGIDAYFLELFQMKYPQYAIKFTTYILNTKDFSYQKQKLKEFENFLLLDKSIFPEVVGFTARNPFKDSSKMFPYIEQAARSEKLYGMSPYMSYAMKKFASLFWKRAFPSEAAKRNFAVYETLTDLEKITVDYLQYLNFEEKLLDSGYNFEESREAYNEDLGSGNIHEGVIEDTLSNYMTNFQEHKRQLLFYQEIVTKTYKGEVFEPKTSRDDIVELLMKFVARNSSGLFVGAPANNGPRLGSRLTLRAAMPRNQRTQIESRLAMLKQERNDLLKNSPVYNEATKTRRNRNEINRMYKNRLSRLGMFSRLTKSKERRNLELKRNVAKATFNRLDALNRNIQDLEQQVATLPPRRNTGAGVGLSSAAAALENA